MTWWRSESQANAGLLFYFFSFIFLVIMNEGVWLWWLMNQVKGHIDEMAIRLEDEDERISNLARLFFHELSKKGSLWLPSSSILLKFVFGYSYSSTYQVHINSYSLLSLGSNPVYNLLPDMLGKLSSRNLQRESFCNIMQFLIGSIKKVEIQQSWVSKSFPHRVIPKFLLSFSFPGQTNGCSCWKAVQ